MLSKRKTNFLGHGLIKYSNINRTILKYKFQVSSKSNEYLCRILPYDTPKNSFIKVKIMTSVVNLQN